VDLAIIDVI